MGTHIWGKYHTPGDILTHVCPLWYTNYASPTTLSHSLPHGHSPSSSVTLGIYLLMYVDCGRPTRRVLPLCSIIESMCCTSLSTSWPFPPFLGRLKDILTHVCPLWYTNYVSPTTLSHSPPPGHSTHSSLILGYTYSCMSIVVYHLVESHYLVPCAMPHSIHSGHLQYPSSWIYSLMYVHCHMCMLHLTLYHLASPPLSLPLGNFRDICSLMHDHRANRTKGGLTTSLNTH